jgi:RNA polymerase sigma factor (sigma-70 family)
MPQDASFLKLMERLKTGDAEACAVIFRRYGHRLIALAGRKLSAANRAVVDGSDIALSVLKTFFHRHKDDPFDLDNEGALWGLLVRITLRKCYKSNQKIARRDPKGKGMDELSVASELPDPAPTPAEAIILQETVTELLGDLDEESREICVLRLQGFQGREIAERINRTKETVSRKLSRIRKRLHKLLPENG